MDTKIISKEELKIIGISVRTTNKNGEGIHKAAELWGRFIGQNLLERIPNKSDPAVNFGVYIDYDKDFNVGDGYYTYVVGTRVDSLEDVPEGMTGITVPAAKYAVLTVKGQMPDRIGEAWGYIWGAWSGDTGCQRAFTADFEVYDSERYTGEAGSEMDINISIK